MVPTPPFVIAISLALAVIPVPPATFRVTSPDVPPSVNPVPATTEVMSPAPVAKSPKSTYLRLLLSDLS